MSPLILLVDDAPDVGAIVRRLGERAGQRVEVRPSGEQAWEFLLETRPDLAILDVNLPGISGPELCRRLRAAPRLTDLPVAILSQPDRPDDIAAGLDAGVDHVISKDLLIDPAEWGERVKEVLAVGRALRPARSSFHSHYKVCNLAARLGEPVLAALLRRISRHEGATAASNVQEWLASMDGTAEANQRLADLSQQLEQVLGRQWCNRLWTALEPAPKAKA